MTLRDIAAKLELTDLTPEIESQKTGEVEGAHASDLLSDVLAHAPVNGLLVTLQSHMNVVAVATHAGLAGIIFSSGRKPDAAVLKKAVEEKMPLFATKDTTFDAAGKLYALGLRGKRL
jgi:hypothetical protein